MRLKWLLRLVGLHVRADLDDAYIEGRTNGYHEGYFEAKRGVFYKEWARHEVGLEEAELSRQLMEA
jgi:hypothetical protein